MNQEQYLARLKSEYDLEFKQGEGLLKEKADLIQEKEDLIQKKTDLIQEKADLITQLNKWRAEIANIVDEIQEKKVLFLTI